MSYAQHMCDARNKAMTRRDIEWAVNSAGGMYLRDRAEWSAKRTATIHADAERERADWKHRQSNPVSPIAGAQD